MTSVSRFFYGAKGWLLTGIGIFFSIHLHSQDSSANSRLNKIPFSFEDPKSPLLPPFKMTDSSFTSQFNTQRLIRRLTFPKTATDFFKFRSLYNTGVMGNPKSLITISGGSLSYNLFYRSSIDTPFIEKNIIQHNTYGSMNILAGFIPLRVNYLLRRTNSQYYNDINDVQVEFDAASFGMKLKVLLRDKLNAALENSRDSLLELNYKFYLEKLKTLADFVTNPLNGQKLRESYEIINIPGLSYKSDVADSVNLKKEAFLKSEAQKFIALYNKQNEVYEKVKKQTDTLGMMYQQMVKKIATLKDLISKQLNSNLPLSDITKLIEKEGLGKIDIPAKYKLLMNTRKLSLGRSPLNQSELTAKNISINGINYEYNSKIYFAFTAGKINYRFRDFAFNQNKRNPQYLIMTRLGIGNIYKNYFIASVFKGKKQLFTSTNNYSRLNTIDVTGISLEARYKITPNSYILGEVAESLCPDFRITPASTQKIELKEKINKAFTIKGYTYFPKTRSVLEGMYKFTGANFQSFTTLQTNSETKSWYVKGEQSFFKRKLKLSGSIRKNDFSNPYIIQRYSSNTLYKSILAVFRAKKWPAVSIGYIPVSQLTSVDSQLVENNFQSINANLNHSFKLGIRRANLSIVYNKFFNSEADTSLLYYNAVNIITHGSVCFDHFDLEAGGTHSVNTNYQLDILEGGVRIKVLKSLQAYFGFKVNNFNRISSEVGGAASIQFNLKRLGAFNLFYDNSFVPTNNKSFIRNEMLNFSFTRFF